MPAAESGPRYSLKQGLDKFDHMESQGLARVYQQGAVTIYHIAR